MQSRKIGARYILRLDKGEEIADSIRRFARENGIKAGRISGIGAADDISIGFFGVNTKEYFAREFTGNLEITTLAGNLTTLDNEPHLHAHVSFADEEMNMHGGHLNTATVSATCELIIDVIDEEINRIYDEETGLNLLDLH